MTHFWRWRKFLILLRWGTGRACYYVKCTWTDIKIVLKLLNLGYMSSRHTFQWKTKRVALLLFNLFLTNFLWQISDSSILYFSEILLACCIRINLIYRNSHLEVFCKKGVLKSFTTFKGKHLCQSLCFNKVKGLSPVTLLKKDSGAGAFLWNLRNF